MKMTILKDARDRRQTVNSVKVAMSNRVAASFRDPSGFVFKKGDEFYRQINTIFQKDFELLHSSGLYDQLVKKSLLLNHQIVDVKPLTEAGYIVIKPEQLAFVSQPYEWSFSQLKAAALATLRIQKLALVKGMSLKDASAYNIQFVGMDAKLLDTLSLEQYQEGKPWVAYRQFCEHFLAPLALMAKTDIDLSRLLINYIDGIPLALASKILPLSTRLNFSLLVHIHLHAHAQRKNAGQKINEKHQQARFSKQSFLALIDSLLSCVNKLQWKAADTEWHDYYHRNNNYEGDSLDHKEMLVEQWIAGLQPRQVWDMGANTGRFSRAAAKNSELVCAWDMDPACVDINYRQVKANSESNILPLLQDLTNPSPAIGWANHERESLTQRGSADVIMALGLIHHLCISNNLPLQKVAAYFALLGKRLIIEFVPKNDSQVQKLLQNREDIFSDYDQQGFLQAFGEYFEIEKQQDIEGTVRTLYLLKAKD